MKVACGNESRTADSVQGKLAKNHVVGFSMCGPGPKVGSWECFKGVGGPSLRDAAGWAEGPSSFCPKMGWGKGLEEPIGLFKLEAYLVPLREPVPSRAPPEIDGSFAELEQELLAVGNVGGMESSLSRLKITDDALLDEASRYPLHLKLPIFSLGFGASSPSTPFMGPDGVVTGKVGVSSGLCGVVEGARSRASPCEERLEDSSAHEDWNLSPRATGGDVSGPELAIVPFGVVSESPLVETMALQVEEEEGEEGWSSSCLAKFNHCLGMTTVGFEEEILYLLRRMRGKIEQKNQDREYKRQSRRPQNPTGN